MADTKPIQSVQRALQIIDLFDEGHLELSLADIASMLSLNKSTAYGLIRTLESNGYLVQNPISKYYHLGTKFISRSLCAVSSLHIISIASPFLLELNNKYRFATNLFLNEQGNLLCVYGISAHSVLSMKTEVGTQIPLFASASGKALAATYSPEELQERIQQIGLTSYTTKTVTDPDKLSDQLAEVRAKGYSFENQEIQIGISSIAVVLRNNSHVEGTISMTGSLQQMKTRLEDMAVDIMIAAKKISSLLNQN